MKEQLAKAIERYSKAVERRICSKAKLHRAQLEEQSSRHELTVAKEQLRTLEMELNEGVISPMLMLSSISLEAKHSEEGDIISIGNEKPTKVISRT